MYHACNTIFTFKVLPALRDGAVLSSPLISKRQMESLQGGEVIFPSATHCLFGRIQAGAWDFAVPG